ncbi:MAG TPA: hypothetical protein VGD11_07405 [Mycobacteriales bacterium]|jgi:hypothetical protein|nr:hypothetical protein [Mycobacterium sp.]
MTRPMFGTVLFVLLLIICWRSRGAIFPVLIALLLGVTITAQQGALANTSVSVADGLRNGLTTLSRGLFGSA